MERDFARDVTGLLEMSREHSWGLLRGDRVRRHDRGEFDIELKILSLLANVVPRQRFDALDMQTSLKPEVF